MNARFHEDCEASVAAALGALQALLAEAAVAFATVAELEGQQATLLEPGIGP